MNIHVVQQAIDFAFLSTLSPATHGVTAVIFPPLFTAALACHGHPSGDSVLCCF